MTPHTYCPALFDRHDTWPAWHHMTVCMSLARRYIAVITTWYGESPAKHYECRDHTNSTCHKHCVTQHYTRCCWASSSCCTIASIESLAAYLSFAVYLSASLPCLASCPGAYLPSSLSAYPALCMLVCMPPVCLSAWLPACLWWLTDMV